MGDIILDNNIENFKNKYEGERIFLIGNGPSLSDTPLDRLTSEYSFAMNKINNIYSETEWRPSFYYVSQTPDHSEAPHKGANEYIQQNIELDIPCFLNSDYYWYNAENVHRMNVSSLYATLFDDLSHEAIEQANIDMLREFWSENPAHLVYHYHTMYGVIQLIKYMGFEQIYLLGTDLGFKYINPHMIFDNGMDPYRYQGTVSSYLKRAQKQGTLGRSFVNGAALKIIQSHYIKEVLNMFLSNSDSHFSTDYDERFRIHDGPSVDMEIIKTHKVAKRICEADGVNIYNATLGGELEVYERVDLEALI